MLPTAAALGPWDKPRSWCDPGRALGDSTVRLPWAPKRVWGCAGVSRPPGGRRGLRGHGTAPPREETGGKSFPAGRGPARASAPPACGRTASAGRQQLTPTSLRSCRGPGPRRPLNAQGQLVLRGAPRGWAGPAGGAGRSESGARGPRCHRASEGDPEEAQVLPGVHRDPPPGVFRRERAQSALTLPAPGNGPRLPEVRVREPRAPPPVRPPPPLGPQRARPALGPSLFRRADTRTLGKSPAVFAGAAASHHAEAGLPPPASRRSGVSR